MKRTRTCMILGMALLLSISLFVNSGRAAETDIISFISITGGDRLIYLMNTRGEMLREPFVIGPVRLYGLTWAPDGRSFAYYLTQNGNSDIYVMDVRTKAHRQLTFEGARDWSPAWSPNGKWIAYVLVQLPEILPKLGLAEDIFANSVICVVHTADIGGGEPLETTRKLVAGSLGWVPDGFLSVSPGVEKQTTLWGKLKKADK